MSNAVNNYITRTSQGDGWHGQRKVHLRIYREQLIHFKERRWRKCCS